MKGEQSARVQSIKSIGRVYSRTKPLNCGMDAHVSGVNLACTGDKCASMYQPEAYVKHGTTGAYPRPVQEGATKPSNVMLGLGRTLGPSGYTFRLASMPPG